MTTFTKIITLSSSNCERQNGDFLSRVKFNFTKVLTDFNNVMYNTVSIQSAEIPYSFYNVSEIHNTIKYQIAGVAYTMVVPEGQYNANSFKSTFSTLFQQESHGKLCLLTIDKITGKYLLTPSDNTFTITLLKEGSTLFRILGLSQHNHTFSFNQSGTSFTYPCNFLGVTKLKIFSDALSCDNLDSSVLGENNLIDTISVNAPTFGLIGFNATQHNECLMKHKIVQNIDVQIRDERNDLVDFNNQDWSITFVINSTTSEDFTPTEEFGGLIKLREKARMIKKLKENHKEAPVMKKLLEKELEAEEDISELSDDDLELILEVPDVKK